MGPCKIPRLYLRFQIANFIVKYVYTPLGNKYENYYRVLQNITEYYCVFLAHLLGPIFGLVFNGK